MNETSDHAGSMIHSFTRVKHAVRLIDEDKRGVGLFTAAERVHEQTCTGIAGSVRQ